ncbi:hypothetical protein ACQU0X_01240 [Pseudovibrio ascidiaceicola]|uniref:hypothetical protein n=1 Tax=Pseudovibrio ascidiaceicola TaxID=285279 RepID=UPI003D35A464
MSVSKRKLKKQLRKQDKRIAELERINKMSPAQTKQFKNKLKQILEASNKELRAKFENMKPAQDTKADNQIEKPSSEHTQGPSVAVQAVLGSIEPYLKEAQSPALGIAFVLTNGQQIQPTHNSRQY